MLGLCETIWLRGSIHSKISLSQYVLTMIIINIGMTNAQMAPLVPSPADIQQLREKYKSKVISLVVILSLAMHGMIGVVTLTIDPQAGGKTLLLT